MHLVQRLSTEEVQLTTSAQPGIEAQPKKQIGSGTEEGGTVSKEN
jgi:hypothetical protein